MPSSPLSAEDLATLRVIGEPALSRDGRLLAFGVNDPAPARGTAGRADIWMSIAGERAIPLTSGPGVDALPRFAPSGRMLAFTSDRLTPGRRDAFILELDPDGRLLGAPRPLTGLRGDVEQMLWSIDGRSILLRIADAGSDASNAGGAMRSPGAGNLDAGISVRRPGELKRRAVMVDLETGRRTEVGPLDRTVWELGWSGDGLIVALVSSDSSENGWYDAEIVRLDPETRTTETLQTSTWQLQSPTPSPDGSTVAYIEAPQSDRGFLAGDLMMLDIATLSTQKIEVAADVARIGWTEDGRLFWAGRQSFTSVCGFARPGDRADASWSSSEVWRGEATLGTALTMVDLSADGRWIAAPKQGHGEPPEMSVLETTLTHPAWRPLTALNSHLVGKVTATQRVHTWTARDGLVIEGLLLLPACTPSDARLPMVVVAHGGPTNAWMPLFASGPHGGEAHLLTGLGCAVLLPNPRGSLGRGHDFMAANMGDLGGGDLADLEDGVASLVDEGVVDRARVGIVGVSYGGYMAAWAAVTSKVFAMAIPIASITNWLSFHHTSNQGRMGEVFLEPFDQMDRSLHWGRSPVMHANGCTTPTLILHGEADRACPVSQAEELYQALAATGCMVQLVTYEGAGHGMSHREHRLDVSRRIVDWTRTHLRIA